MPDHWRLLSIDEKAKIKADTSLPEEIIPITGEEDVYKRISLFNVNLKGAEPIKIGAVHLKDRKNNRDHLKNEEAQKLSKEFNKEERLILIGDFNSKPFNLAMAAANGFNATSSKRIALKKTREFDGQVYSYFYTGRGVACVPFEFVQAGGKRSAVR